MKNNYNMKSAQRLLTLLLMTVGISQAYAQYTISHIAGDGSGYGVASYGDNRSATSTPVAAFGVAADASGNLYVADYSNRQVRKISTSGTVTSIAGQRGVYGNSGVPGTASATTIAAPCATSMDASGNLYVSDESNFVIYKITPAGYMSIYAGGGGGGDGSAAASASLYYPEGIALDAAGNLYIADNAHGRIRKVTASTGIISTVAGGGSDYSHDGISATSASITPFGIALDPLLAIYISVTGGAILSAK